MRLHPIHHWLNDRELPNGRRTPMFAAPAGGGSGSNPGRGTQAAAPVEDQNRLTEAKLEEQRNARFIEKLDKLVGRNALKAETAEDAKNVFKSGDSNRKALARMLAKEQISEMGYNQVDDALTSETTGKKSLARLVVRRRLDVPTFQEALMDLESGNTYRGPLAQRLASDRIDAEEYQWARRFVESADPAEVDQRTYSQQLARGDLTPQNYRTQMSALTAMPATRDETSVEAGGDPVAEIQIDIHAQIIEVLERMGAVMSALPEHEKTQPIQKIYSEIHRLNNNERSNHVALIGHIRPLNLPAEQFKYIMEFDADSQAELETLRTRLGDFGLPSVEVGQIMTFKNREYELEKEFIELNEGMEKIMQVVQTKINNDILEKRMLEEWERSTGITIAAGTKLGYIYPDEIHGNVKTLAITSVTTQYAPVPDSEGNVIGQIPKGFTVFLNDGRQWGMGQFNKWVNAVDAYEIIDSQTEMQELLGLPDVGMSLKNGQTLEYRTGFRRDENGNIVPQSGSVKIREIDDQKVRLSAPVETLNPAEEPGLNLSAPRMAAEMSLGEFAKWSKRHDMIPNIATLGELKEHLRQYNTFANVKKFPHRKAELYPALTLEPGEWVQPGDSRGERIQITGADDSGISFESGEKLTLPQFFKWVRDNNIERANPDDLASREADAAGNLGEPTEEAKKGFLKRLTNAFRANKEPGEAPGHPPTPVEAKSIFGTMGQVRPIGPFKEIFYEYQFMSIMDLINMGKEIIEFIKRKHQRKSKHRYSTIGSKLPGQLGTEFQRVNQSAETEEVNQYKEAMDQWGTWQILGKLHDTNSKDEAKACFLVLTEKGEIRWDDMKIWDTLNRLTSKYTGQGAKLYIPLSQEAQPDPNDPTRWVSGEDRALTAIDALWGEGGGADWYSKTVSSYDSKKSAFEHKGRQLEADPKGTGGLEAELSRLLRDWKAGNYVNPIEYEELVDFAISAGKLSSEQKLFFLMEGVSAQCGGGPMEGMTLLHVDRIGALDGKYLNQFPMLDYFTNKGKKPFHPGYTKGEITLDGTQKGYRQEDYQALRDENFKGDSSTNRVGKQFSKFLWENMLLDENFQTRLSKGLRAAQNMDHDDAHMFIPPATLEDIKMLTGSHNGQQKYFTNEGYKNGYVGFNQYIVSLSNRNEVLKESFPNNIEMREEQLNTNTQRLLQAIQGYFLFDSYLDGRNDMKNDHRARLGSRMDSYAVNDRTMLVRGHQTQLSNMVKAICDGYGIKWKEEKLFDKPEFGNKASQDLIEKNIDHFLNKTLPDKIKENPKIMFDIINERKLRAINNVTDPDALAGIPASNRLLQT